MSSIFEMITQKLDGNRVQQIAGELGTNEQTTQKAIQAALPALLGGITKNVTGTPGGARALAGALDRDHDGSIIDDLPGMLSGLSGQGGGLGGLLGTATSLLGGSSQANQRTMNGAGILGHILGNKRGAIEQNISQTSGLDLASVAKLLPMLAPIVMGFLGKMKRQNNLDEGGLVSMLTQERSQIDQQAPAAGGLLGLLDSDGDGNVADDLGKIGTGLLGSFLDRK